MSRWVLLCVGLPSFFGWAQVRAEDADELVKRGIELRRKAKDAEALAEFKKAWAISKTPRIEAQMAFAEQALGLWVAAEEHILDALTHGQSDPWTKKNSATLNSALTIIQTHLGTLSVWGTPAGAAVFVNEKSVGTLPLEHPVRLSDDSAILRVRADGFREWTRTVRVDPGQTVREHVELIPIKAANGTGIARGDTSPAESADTPASEAKAAATIPEASPPSATAPRADVPSSSSRGLRPYAWAAGAGAVLGLGLGVVETLVAYNKRNQFNNMMECGTSSLTSTCRTIQGDHDQAVTLATVGYASAGGLAVLSAVLFILSSAGDENPSASMAQACVGDVALRGVACVFSF